VPRYICKKCQTTLATDVEICPSCGLKDPLPRCRACREIIMPGTLKCPACKAKAPLLSKRLMLIRAFILPTVIVILIALMSLFKQ